MGRRQAKHAVKSTFVAGHRKANGDHNKWLSEQSAVQEYSGLPKAGIPSTSNKAITLLVLTLLILDMTGQTASQYGAQTVSGIHATRELSRFGIAGMIAANPALTSTPQRFFAGASSLFFTQAIPGVYGDRFLNIISKMGAHISEQEKKYHEQDEKAKLVQKSLSEARETQQQYNENKYDKFKEHYQLTFNYQDSVDKLKEQYVGFTFFKASTIQDSPLSEFMTRMQKHKNSLEYMTEEANKKLSLSVKKLNTLVTSGDDIGKALDTCERNRNAYYQAIANEHEYISKLLGRIAELNTLLINFALETEKNRDAIPKNSSLAKDIKNLKRTYRIDITLKSDTSISKNLLVSHVLHDAALSAAMGNKTAEYVFHKGLNAISQTLDLINAINKPTRAPSPSSRTGEL